MNKKTVLLACGTAALGISLTALPAVSGQKQTSQDDSVAALKREIAELKAKLSAAQDAEEFSKTVIADTPEALEALEAPEAPAIVDLDREVFNIQEPETPAPPAAPSVIMSLDRAGGSWLGVETQEVTSEKAKSLRLNGEHGALIGKVLPDSPAAKAGLKENDIVTDINGQRVEGTAQFRRMIREIPGGRTIQLGVWRDGKQQNISATLGKSEERRNAIVKAMPQTFNFRIPAMPEIPEIRNFEWNGGMLLAGKPRLGVDIEDISGQLGSYFGAPDGEGILVRNVNPDSPAEKGGVKAGDVITTFNGEHIHTAGELREKLSAVEGGKSVTLGILRNKSNVSVTVELQAPAPKEKRRVSLRTNI